GQPIPPMKAVPAAVEVNLTDHEVSAEDVVDDQSRDVTVAPCRVVGPPASTGEVIRRTRVGSPTSAQGFVNDQQVPRDHAANIAVATDIGRSPRPSSSSRPGSSNYRSISPARRTSYSSTPGFLP